MFTAVLYLTQFTYSSLFFVVMFMPRIYEYIIYVEEQNQLTVTYPFCIISTVYSP